MSFDSNSSFDFGLNSPINLTLPLLTHTLNIDARESQKLTFSNLYSFLISFQLCTSKWFLYEKSSRKKIPRMGAWDIKQEKLQRFNLEYSINLYFKYIN